MISYLKRLISCVLKVYLFINDVDFFNLNFINKNRTFTDDSTLVVATHKINKMTYIHVFCSYTNVHGYMKRLATKTKLNTSRQHCFIFV